MAERPTPKTLEAAYARLNWRDLAEVQRREKEMADKNRKTLRFSAARVRELGLFPTMRVVFGSLGDKYDIRDHPLIVVGSDPESKNMSVCLDADGELHLLHALSPGETEVEQGPVLDFTVFERGVASNEQYMNFTKLAIRKLMAVVNRAMFPPEPQV